jgi:hypothetical protein
MGGGGGQNATRPAQFKQKSPLSGKAFAWKVGIVLPAGAKSKTLPDSPRRGIPLFSGMLHGDGENQLNLRLGYHIDIVRFEKANSHL